MMLLNALTVTFILRSLVAANNRTFPDGFMFGVTTSAYQVEGAWNEDGKGETIWDYLVHHRASYADNNATGDVACDSYHKFKKDIALAAHLRMKHFKLSIAWSRIFPDGFGSGVNLKGISHYQAVIDELQSHNITPIVSLYHWDLPQHLQDIGGWTNPAIISYFVKYARTAFKYFNNVKYWVTFDEPRQICRGGYGIGTFAPQINVDGVAEYLCSYVVVKAHAQVYDLYKKEFSALGGKVGIVLDIFWSEPYSDKSVDIAAAERRNYFMFGLYATPIVHGNWPQTVYWRVKYRSDGENFTRSRLPELTDDEVDFIYGKYDYIGINFCDTRYVEDDEESEHGDPNYEYDLRAKVHTDDTWLVAPNGNTIVPWGIRKALNWIKNIYNNPIILITDNSIATNGSLNDDDRMEAIAKYLENVLDAMYEDNVNVIGYTLSLMDKFEWNFGYSVHDGLYSVDFEDSNRNRTERKSAEFYRKIAMDLVIPNIGPNDTTTTMTTEISTTETPTETTTISTEPSIATTTSESTSLPTEATMESTTAATTVTTTAATTVPTTAATTVTTTAATTVTTTAATTVTTTAATTVTTSEPTTQPDSSSRAEPLPIFIIIIIFMVTFY